VFCDGKAVVLPSAKEGVAAMGSCQGIEDFIKVIWALIWYFVYFLEAQVLLILSQASTASSLNPWFLL
jgi:hypothetical protein